MYSWSGILLFCYLHIIHKCFSFGLGSRTSWSCMFVFEVKLVRARCRDSRELLCDKINNLLSAWISFFLRGIFFDEAAFVVNSRPWSFLSLCKICFSVFFSYFAPRISAVCEIDSRFCVVFIRGWSFFCFSEIFPFWCSHKDSVSFVGKLALLVIDRRSWFVDVMIINDFMSGFASVSHGVDWGFSQDQFTLIFVVLWSRGVFIIVEEPQTYRSLDSILAKK